MACHDDSTINTILVLNRWKWESECCTTIAKKAVYSVLQPHLHWVMTFHMTSLVRSSSRFMWSPVKVTFAVLELWHCRPYTLS